MKTLEWLHFFGEQRALHGKSVFSVAELANAAQTTPHALNTELGRLLRHGLVSRYAHGFYGPPQGVNPEEIPRALDPGAYITGFFALFHHHLVTQVPAEITCFTNRRHNRGNDRVTPVGRLRFICVPPGIYAKPAGQVMAAAEQALCDFAWLNLRKGVDPRSLVTFRNLDALNPRRLRKTLQRYPPLVRNGVSQIVRQAGLREVPDALWPKA